jgi:hypothetical protein
VASVALIGASIAGFTSLYSAADHKVPAVVTVRPVSQGQPITSADLGTADVSVSSAVAFIPVAQASVVAGKRAASAIPAGALLSMGDLSAAPAIVPGDAVVGIALKDGAYPAAGLTPGDQVLVVQTAAPGSVVAAPTAGASTATGTAPFTAGAGGITVSGAGAGTEAAGTGVLVAQATVVTAMVPVTPSSGGNTLLVSIEVPTSSAAPVSTAAVAGQVGLVLLPANTSAAPSSSGQTGASS